MAQDIALLVKCNRTAIEIFRRLIRSNRHQKVDFPRSQRCDRDYANAFVTDWAIRNN